MTNSSSGCIYERMYLVLADILYINNRDIAFGNIIEVASRMVGI